MSRALAAAAAAASIALLLAGCGAADRPSGSAESTGGADSSPATESAEITVFAAASLTASFTEIAEAFEEAHPGTVVSLNFAGSSSLLTQLEEGAPADVFAAADERTMTSAADADLLAEDPEIFASNTLEIAVPAGNPAGIASFVDLADPEVTLVVCAPQVPCGAATALVAQAAGVTLAPVSEESAVTDVLGKVSSGEADAGIVYRTDVQGAGDTVEGIEFPEATDAVNRYPIATLAGSAAPDLAAAFVAFVTGSEGQAILAAAGFGAG